jgi:hypothetical protein
MDWCWLLYAICWCERKGGNIPASQTAQGRIQSQSSSSTMTNVTNFSGTTSFASSNIKTIPTKSSATSSLYFHFVKRCWISLSLPHSLLTHSLIVILVMPLLCCRKLTDDDNTPRMFHEISVEIFSLNSPVNCCKFSPNGTHFACGTKGGIVK